MDNSVIAKSGWLFRQTSVLKWKKSWVELYRDGYLKYYENECSPNAEDIIFMPTECLVVKAGLQVEGVHPPEGYGIQNVFSVVTSAGKTWIFCGESLDDMRAWQLALEQARLFGIPPHLSSHLSAYMPSYNPGYTPTYSNDSSLTFLPQYTYPPATYYGYTGPQFMTSSLPVQNTVFYHPDRYRPEGTDMILGGTPMGSLMWGPLLWW